MRAVEVHGVGLPGVGQVDLDLGSPTLISGANGTGKSTALRMAMVALEGPVERLGAAGEVSVVFDDGTTVWRAQTPNGHKLEVRGPGLDVSGVRKGQEAIARHLGGALFDVLEFVGLSAQARAQALNKLVDASWTPSLDVERFNALLGPVVRRYPWNRQRGGQAQLRMLEEGLKEAGRSNEEAVRKARAQTATAPEPPGSVPGGTVASWRARVSALDVQIATMEREAGRAESARQVREGLERELRGVGDQMAELERVGTKRSELRQLRDRYQTVLDEIRTEAADLAGSLTGLREDVEAARGVVLERNATLQAAHAARNEQLALREAWERAGGVLEAIRPALATVPRPWSDEVVTLAALAEGMSAGADLRGLEAASETVSSARQGLDSAQRRLGAAERILGRREQELRKAAARVAKGERTVEGVDAQIAALATAEQVEAQRAELERQRDELVERLEEVPAAGGAAVAALEGLRMERAEALRSADKLHDLETSRVQQADRAAELARCLERRAALKEGLEEVRACIRASMDAALSPITGPASELTVAAMDRSLSFDLSPKGADVLIVGPGGEAVPLGDASDSEQVIALAALRLAVQSLAGGWRHAFVDQLEQLDHDRRTRLCEALLRWYDTDKIDTIALACVDDGWSPPPAFSIHRRTGCPKTSSTP